MPHLLHPDRSVRCAFRHRLTVRAVLALLLGHSSAIAGSDADPRLLRLEVLRDAEHPISEAARFAIPDGLQRCNGSDGHDLVPVSLMSPLSRSKDDTIGASA